jgi:hypothetical protein
MQTADASVIETGNGNSSAFRLLQKLPASVVYFGLFFLLFLFTQLVRFNGLYGQDSYAYVRIAGEWRTFLLGGALPGFSHWPPIYPLLGGLLGILLPVHLSLQLISIGAHVFAGFLLEKILPKLYPESRKMARSYALLFLIFSPFLLRTALCDMSDSLSMFFVILAWYVAISMREQYRATRLYLFAFAAAAGIMTRYGVFVLIVPAIFLVIKPVLRNKSLSQLFLAMLFASAVCLPLLLLRSPASLDFLKKSWLEEWSPMNFLLTTFSNSNGHYSYTVQNIIYAVFAYFHPGFLFLGAGVLFFRKSIEYRNRQVLVILIALGCYSLFLAGIPFQNMRFFVPAMPLFLLVFFPVFQQGYAAIRFNTTWVLIGILLLQAGLFTRAFLPFYRYNAEERAITQACITTATGPLYEFSMEGALTFYGFKNRQVSLWDEKLQSVDKNTFLLFNLPLLEKEFAGRNPMINFEFIRANARLEPIQQLPGGWTLYAIR